MVVASTNTADGFESQREGEADCLPTIVGLNHAEYVLYNDTYLKLPGLFALANRLRIFDSSRLRPDRATGGLVGHLECSAGQSVVLPDTQ